MEEQKPNNPNSSKYTNLEPRIAGALAYLVGPLSGVALFLIEKEDKFVRFHAFQSILFGIAWFALWTIISSIGILYLLWGIVQLAGFAAWIFLMWKAYNNEMYEIPFLGKIAKDQTNK